MLTVDAQQHVFGLELESTGLSIKLHSMESESWSVMKKVW